MVRFFHVALAYGGNEVLSDVTLSLGGETVVMAGPGGAGKSVLLRLLCGLEAPTRGWITVDGLPLVDSAADVLAAHRRRLAIVPQTPLLVEDVTATENVAFALEVQGIRGGPARVRACDALDRIGVAALRDRRVAGLSASERRLVGLARALVRDDASLVVADDPTSGLGAEAAARIGGLLAEEAARGATVVIASQQPGLPGLVDARVVFLDDGRVSWDSCGERAKELP